MDERMVAREDGMLAIGNWVVATEEGVTTRVEKIIEEEWVIT